MEEFLESIKNNFKEVTFDFQTISIKVDSNQWVETHKLLKESFQLNFFSWLSAIDWDNDVSVGDAPKEQVTPSFEIISCLSDTTSNRLLTISTLVPKTEPTVPTLTDIFAGANWHEREAFEMFGITFEGHPNLEKLYLPDGYEGNPMLKSFELISREVKPWPGDVDVEGMPEGSEDDESADATEKLENDNS